MTCSVFPAASVSPRRSGKQKRRFYRHYFTTAAEQEGCVIFPLDFCVSAVFQNFAAPAGIAAGTLYLALDKLQDFLFSPFPRHSGRSCALCRLPSSPAPGARAGASLGAGRAGHRGESHGSGAAAGHPGVKAISRNSYNNAF